MKKIIITIIISLLIITGCTPKEKNIEGSLYTIMDKIYEGINNEDFDQMEKIEITEENKEYYLGNITFKYIEALASEPVMSSIAHSVVLIRLDKTTNIENAKKELKQQANPKKWICTEVDENNVIVENKGNLLILIMDNTYSNELKNNFLSLE